MHIWKRNRNGIERKCLLCGKEQLNIAYIYHHKEDSMSSYIGTFLYKENWVDA